VEPGYPRIRPDRRTMRVQFFQERDVAALESAINAWLGLDPRREVVHVLQTEVEGKSGREIVVSVWYIPGV